MHHYKQTFAQEQKQKQARNSQGRTRSRGKGKSQEKEHEHPTETVSSTAPLYAAHNAIAQMYQMSDALVAKEATTLPIGALWLQGDELALLLEVAWEKLLSYDPSGSGLYGVPSRYQPLACIVRKALAVFPYNRQEWDTHRRLVLLSPDTYLTGEQWAKVQHQAEGETPTPKDFLHALDLFLFIRGKQEEPEEPNEEK